MVSALEMHGSGSLCPHFALPLLAACVLQPELMLDPYPCVPFAFRWPSHTATCPSHPVLQEVIAKGSAVEAALGDKLDEFGGQLQRLKGWWQELIPLMLSEQDFQGSYALSVFGGSFSQEAAMRVGPVTAKGLRELLNMAVLQETGGCFGLVTLLLQPAQWNAGVGCSCVSGLK